MQGGLDFGVFAPCCPACRTDAQSSALAVTAWTAEGGGQGILACQNSVCGARYPVISGIPVLVSDMQRYLADAGVYLLARDDLWGPVSDLIGAGMPPGAWFDASRQHLSGYVRDHWGMFDTADTDSPAPGQAWALAQAGLALAERSGFGTVSGPVVELGAAAGGVTGALSRLLKVPVLGIDLSAPLARFAAKALRGGACRYPLRVGGTAYAVRHLELPAGRDDTAIWLADALAPPLPHGMADLVVALNLIDCVADPARLMRQAASLLRPGGRLIACTPCDWNVNATSPAMWVGGREEADGAPDLGVWAAGCTGLHLIGRDAAVRWDVRVHARATMTYQVEIIVLQRPFPAR
jgi:SAM-dependent methyltransferase/uncharacterized protein YbaR (Trm112 family)